MLKCEGVNSSSSLDSEADNGHEKPIETQPIRQALKSREQIRDKVTNAIEELRLLVNSWEQDSATSLLPELNESGEPDDLETHEPMPFNRAPIEIFKGFLSSMSLFRLFAHFNISIEKTENELYFSPDMQLSKSTKCNR